ncbi:MAG: zinc-dependent metalloprotease [Thermoanaerobaculia bacterium]|nr:zinc-dependent metalloprotease [Thermoanaerobaculia bacterium]
MRHPVRSLILVLVVFSALPGGTVALEGAAFEIEFATGELASLAFAPEAGRVAVTAVPLRDGEAPAVLDLWPQQILAADAQLVVHGERGAEIVPFPRHRQFAGEIRGEAGSRAVVTVLEDGEVRGVVSSGAEHWLFQDFGGDLALAAVDARYLPEASGGFACDGALEVPGSALEAIGAVDAPSAPVAPEAGAQYTARVAVETDFEYYAKFNNVSNAIAYIYGLLGYSSTVYAAEISTSLLVSHVSLRTTSSDPWNETGSYCALFEFGRWWNNNQGSIPRTLAHMLSGKGTGGGIAWVGVLCSGAFTTSHGGSCPNLTPQSSNYGGAYSFVGSISGSFNPANPTVMWDIMASAHEMGHNFASRHTHCYNNVGGNANPIDGCYNTESGCYSGTAGLPGIGTVIGGTSGQGNGTIMSYCHLRGGGYSNVTMTFGTTHPYGVLASRVPAVMQAHVASRAAANPSCFIPSLFTDGFETGLVPPWSAKRP